ncbi:hypothetical protein Ga0100231_024150 [Opitutaceae bacterium TAV4]|nr:hypothetical protein Ga0100231_024150 [Opitutaceae bacterium TAV4]RRK00804.1 hypothetical protein Ga0100230_023725 [Opitutaceae bacterium TAV3]
MKDTILSILRHLLTIGGGVLVTRGVLGESTVEGLAGTAIAFIGGVWGAVDEYRASKKAKEAANG